MTVAAETLVPPAGVDLGRRPQEPRVWLFVPVKRWPAILWTAAFLSVVFSLGYAQDSLWLSLGVVMMVVIAWHGILASRVIPWIPGLIAGIACIQWVIAPWAAYHLPEIETMQMVIPQHDYFQFVVPATASLVLGLYWPLVSVGRRVPPRGGSVPNRLPELERTCKWMFAPALIVRLVLVSRVPAGFRFVAELVGLLSYVAAYALLLSGAKGWKWRVGAVMAAEAARNTQDGQFLEVLLWGAYTAVLLIFKSRLRASRIFALGIIGLLFIVALNDMKTGFRAVIGKNEMSRQDKTELAASMFWDVVAHPSVMFSRDKLAFNASRLNQGGVTSRVMAWTPVREPFAHGETIVTAVRAALLPRMFAPNKYTAGGADNYPRFTGLRRFADTSINLSIAGEMYVNFGIIGGCVGLFVYGYIVGWLFRLFVKRARQSVYWWAWAPYVLLSTAVAEGGLGETVNQVVKAIVVMSAVILVVPAWAALREKPWVKPATRRPLLPVMGPPHAMAD